MKLKTKKIIAREFLIILLLVLIGIVVYLSLGTYNLYQNSYSKSLSRAIQSKSALKNELSNEFLKKLGNQKWFYKNINEESGSHQLWSELTKLELYTLNYDEFVSQYASLNNQRELWARLSEMELYTKTFSVFLEQYFPQEELYFTDFKRSEYLWEKLNTLLASDSIEDKFYNEWNHSTRNKLKTIGLDNPLKLIEFIETNSLNGTDLINIVKSDSLEREIKATSYSKRSTGKRKISKNRKNDITYNVIIIGIMLLFMIRYIFYSVKWSLRILKEKGAEKNDL